MVHFEYLVFIKIRIYFISFFILLRKFFMFLNTKFYFYRNFFFPNLNISILCFTNKKDKERKINDEIAE
jgi:hypothetical protein